jgi:hypothetical protein
LIQPSSQPPSSLNQERRYIALYIVAFLVIWTAYVAFIYPHVADLGETTLAYALVNITAKLTIWVFPVLIYLRLVDRVDPFDYLKLKRRWQRGIIIALLLSAVNFALSCAMYGIPTLNPARITWNNILSGSFAVGFIEEILFRGFIQQKLELFTSFPAANLLTSLIFLAVHLIGWALLGTLAAVPSLTFVALLATSLILGAALKYSGSLWSSIITHSINDFLAIVLFA